MIHPPASQYSFDISNPFLNDYRTMADGMAEVETASVASQPQRRGPDDLQWLLYSSGSDEFEYSSNSSCGCDYSDDGDCCGFCWDDDYACACGCQGEGRAGGAGCQVNINCGGRDGVVSGLPRRVSHTD